MDGFWKLGDRVQTRFGGEEMVVVSIEHSPQPYYENGLSRKKSKTAGQLVEWVKVKQKNGEIREFAAWDLVRVV